MAMILRAMSFTLTMMLMPVLAFALVHQAAMAGWQSADRALDRLPTLSLVRAEVTHRAGADNLDNEIDEALRKGDVEEARSYIALAESLSLPVAPAVRERLAVAEQDYDSFAGRSGRFLDGFVNGEADDGAALTGAIAADLTVIGDIRDIMREGGALIRDEPYSEFLLGLSVVGLVATTATVASAGSGLPARAGLSLLKVVKRTGRMSAGLTRDLTRAISRAVDFRRLRRTLGGDLMSDPTVMRRGLASAVDLSSARRLTRTGDDVMDLTRQTSLSDTMYLVSRADSMEDLSGLSKLSARFGKATRGLVTVTGRVSLRAFKTAGALLLLAGLHVWSVAAAGLSWLCAFLFGQAVLWVLRGGRRKN